MSDELLTKLKEYGIENIKHVFKIKPCPAPRMTKSDRWKIDPNHPDKRKRQRPAVTRYFQFRKNFMAECFKNKYDLEDVLNLCFVLEMPKSWSIKKKNSNRYCPHQSRPDRDNMLKSVQDAFSKDDGYVWDGRTLKIWGDEDMIIIFD